MKRICVFCGTSPGARPEYVQAARRMGEALADEGLELVFGGGKVGMMGAIAEAVMEKGGRATGVITQPLLELDLALPGLTDLRVVEEMHQRKALMAELSDGFIALPGGLGTLEEFFEAATWAQLEIHSKPCGLLDVEGYFGGLRGFLDRAIQEKFVQAEHVEMIQISDDPAQLLRSFKTYRPPTVDKSRWALEF